MYPTNTVFANTIVFHKSCFKTNLVGIVLWGLWGLHCKPITFGADFFLVRLDPL